MTVTFVQSAGGFTSTTNTVSGTMGQQIAKGNSVICIAQSYSVANVASITGCGITTWQKVISGVGNVGLSGSLDIWFGTNSDGSSNTVTITFAPWTGFGGGPNNTASLIEVSPISLDQALKVENQTGIPITPSLTPSQPGEFLVGEICNTSGISGIPSPWVLVTRVGGYQAQGYLANAPVSAQSMTITGGVSTDHYSAAIVAFKDANPGVKFYTSPDLGGGVQMTNLADPVNPQDVANKRYADTHPPTLYHNQSLWETAYWMPCSSNGYSGAWAGLTTGPNTRAITKRQANTGIRVMFGGTCFSTTGGNVYYGFRVNGSAIVQIFQYYINVANTHLTLPWLEKTLWPSQFSQVGATGAMNVDFFVSTGASQNWSTNNGDWAAWTISEIVP